LGLGAEGNLDAGRDLLAKHGAAFDFLADVLEGQVRAREDPAGQALPLADEAQQKVLGFDRDAPELAGLVPGKEENPSCPFRVPFEHPAYPRYVVVLDGVTPPTVPRLYGIPAYRPLEAGG